MAQHSELDGTDLHSIALVQSSDPGAIGAGKAWIDSDDNALRIRNATDSAWLGPYFTAAGGTFTGDIIVPDEAYDATNWNGSLEAPTKNAVRDKIETLGSGTGTVVQVKNTQTGASATGTTVIPWDDTIPEKTEGDEYMTLAITPTSSSNKLRIDVVTHFTASAVPVEMTVALFQDTATNALAAMGDLLSHATAGSATMFTHYMTAGTTSATTFKVRAGCNTSVTLTFNGSASSRKWGGVCASSITITEIVP